MGVASQKYYIQVCKSMKKKIGLDSCVRDKGIKSLVIKVRARYIIYEAETEPYHCFAI